MEPVIGHSWWTLSAPVESPASRGSWAVLLANDPNGEATFASLKPNTIPVRSQGYSDDPEGERSPYSELFGDQ